MISFWAMVLFLFGDSTCSVSTITAKEGSCVTIHQTLSDIRDSGYIVWLKDAEWNEDIKDYEGTIVYSLKPDKPAASAFENRVSVGSAVDLTNYKLTISTLSREDSGQYVVRYYDKVDPPYELVKNSLEISLEVQENPCQVSVTGPKLVQNGMEVILLCSTVGPCSGSPEWRSSVSGLTSREVYKTQDVKTTQLSFKADWSHDGVEFSCWPSASNEACASRNITLAVEYAPKGVRIKASRTLDGIVEGDAVSLTCEVPRSNPSQQSYTWYRDGTVLGETGPVLRFVALRPEDRGSYRCQASNPEGSGDSPEVTITVRYGTRGTKIKASCCEGGVKAGQRHTLTCEADAHPAPSYTWYRANTVPGGERIQGWTEVPAPLNGRSYLRWQQISEGDAGEYMCQATNSINTEKSSALRVDVLYAPKGVWIKASRTLDGIVDGARVSLTCEIQRSNPSVESYSWYRDGTVLRETGRVLRFVTLRPEDRGSYKCQASNSVGSGESPEVTINVHYAPKEVRITTSSTLDRIVEGDDVSLTCEVQRSNPSVRSYSWYRDGTVLRETGQILRFVAVRPENRGSYRCQASNSAGSGRSPEVLVTIRYGPRGTKIKASCCEKGVKAGKWYTLTCEADAYPAPYSYTWYRANTAPGGERIPGWAEVPGPYKGSYYLRWQQISAGDAGEYMCQATNSINSQNSSALHVDVLYAPKEVRITASRTLNRIVEGDAVSLTCEVQRSNPSVQSYSWYRDGTVLPETGQILHIEAIRPENRGSYYCKASNSEGLGYSLNVRITVHYAPRDVRATANPIGEVTEKTNMNLSCEARSNFGVIAYAWFKLMGGGAEEVGQGPVLTLRNLSEANTGQYFCRTQNGIGEGNSSVINVTVKYGPRKAVVIHNMTSRGQPVKESAVALMCSSQSYPPILGYKWHVQKNDGNPETLIGVEQNLTIGSNMEGVYSCSVENGISNSTSDPIEIRFDRARAQTFGISTLILVMASVCSFIAIFLIIIVVVLVCRKRRKSTQRRLENGSQNDTSQGLVMHGMGDPQRSRETVSAVMAPPPGPATNQHGHDSEPSPSVNTVYSALKIPGKAKQGKLPGMPGGKGPVEEFGMNYASLQFQGKRNKMDPKPEKSAECVYSKVSKPNRKQKEEDVEYDNMKEAAKRWPERETEASKEDTDVCYTAISFAARTGPPGPLGACRRGDSGSLDEDDCKSQNSKVKA